MNDIAVFRKEPSQLFYSLPMPVRIGQNHQCFHTCPLFTGFRPIFQADSVKRGNDGKRRFSPPRSQAERFPEIVASEYAVVSEPVFSGILRQNLPVGAPLGDDFPGHRDIQALRRSRNTLCGRRRLQIFQEQRRLAASSRVRPHSGRCTRRAPRPAPPRRYRCRQPMRDSRAPLRRSWP